MTTDLSGLQGIGLGRWYLYKEIAEGNCFFFFWSDGAVCGSGYTFVHVLKFIELCTKS